MRFVPPASRPPMSAPGILQQARRTWSWWTWLEGFIERMFILFCIYALSIGPMYWPWVSARQAHGWYMVAAFYEPLRILGETFPLFGQTLNWYISLWVGS